MNRFFRPIAALIASASVSLAATEGWTTDLEAAKARAKAENKPIFVYFTGSDWCGWCIRLDKEVLHKPEFKAYAKESLVLLEVDFPRKPENKEKQSAELKAQNKDLDKKFKVEGYPTVFVTDADLNTLGETGYREGGPEKYIEHLKELIAKAAKPAQAAPAETKATE